MIQYVGNGPRNFFQVAGRMALLVTILLMLVNISSTARNHAPVVTGLTREEENMGHYVFGNTWGRQYLGVLS